MRKEKMEDHHGNEKSHAVENFPADEKVIDSSNTQLADAEEVTSDHSVLTRNLLLKLDFRYIHILLSKIKHIDKPILRILPVLTLFFFCSFLDRTNVGNAKTYKLETDLKMTDHQYDTGLAVYYVTYIARYVRLLNSLQFLTI